MIADDGWVIAADVGGTCTDCVVFRSGEPVHIGKSLSTPPDFARGVIDSVRCAADAMGLDLHRLLQSTRLFLHGSTVVDNTIFTRTGARTGLITTAGFEDTLPMTRGAYGRWSGQPEDVVKHPVATDRPRPLVPRSLIRGVPERVDARGAVLEPLDEAAAETAVRELLENGIEAFAICLLWSFRNPAHERRLRDIVQRLAPDKDVSLSCEVASVPGEYERSSTTVINAYCVGATQSYLAQLGNLLSASGYGGELMVMQGYGGLLPAAEAARRPVGMIECGPAAGLIAARFVGDALADENIIAADMGGTTFKIGVIRGGDFEHAREPMVDRFHYVASKLELVSIGAGGGSLVSVDADTRRPRIGPQSAGSRPGPVCYGLGGAVPTLTDVCALLGYMDPNTFLGGTLKLRIDDARRAFEEQVATPMGMGVDAAAIGIYRIACAQLSDLVRSVTVERGLDPREFVLHSFGGSCGLYAGALAHELGIRRVVVPYTASVHCAFGMVASDVVHDLAVVQPMPAPANASTIEAILRPMEQTAADQLEREGFAPERTRFDWAVDLRYRRQVHQVTTPLRGSLPVSEAAAQALVEDFERLYEQRYGRGSAFRAAGVELVRFRLRARGLMARPATPREALVERNASRAVTGERPIFVEGEPTLRHAPTYDFDRLLPGNGFEGPAVVHTPITTIVVQRQQVATLDDHRNLILESVA